jgi:APA family basic amino acid/polyamine antiporter
MVSGALTLAGALVCAELASAYPRTGGVYVFLREAWGPPVGFLWGWAMFWSMHSGIIAAIATVFARYAAAFLPLGDAGVRLVAVGAIVALSAVNYFGVEHGSRLQTAFTIGKLAAIVAIVALGFALPVRYPVAATDAAPAAFGFQDLALAIAAGLFAFGGWHMVTYTAGETADARRTIPIALGAGTLVVTVCYVALNAVYLHVLPVATVSSSTRVAADAADALVGSGGAAIMSALVMFSAFGGLAGIVLVGPRVYYSMARDGLLFGWAGEVHPRFRTPHRAIVLQAIWSSALVLTGTYRALFTRVVYTEWIFFALMAAGLVVLRRRPEYAPAYRVWGYPILPAAFVLSSALIVVNQIVSQPSESALGLLIVGIGWPVYLVWTAVRKRELTIEK